MSEIEKTNAMLDKRSSRRTFIKNSGLTVGGVVLGGALGSVLFKDENSTTETKDHNVSVAANPNVALMFFTPSEYQLTQAAVERIYPADDNGPGAKDLNAAIYIDHQLAGHYGMNTKDYRLGNFYTPEATQGGQTKMLNKDLFLFGLNELNNYSEQNFQTTFNKLEAADQDAVLADFSEGKTKFSGVSSSEFFNLLRKLTLEGVYADPMYGGNKDMQGWAMRKYPGSRMSYVQEIQSKTFVKLEPQGLNSHMGH